MYIYIYILYIYIYILLKSANNYKKKEKYTILGNLKVMNQVVNMETIKMTPFFIHFLALTVSYI